MSQPSRTRLRPLIALFLSASFIASFAVGCTPARPAPDPDGPILTGPQALPKALVTIAPTATPLVQATPTDDGSRPTLTSPPPTITPTNIPLRGTFIGVQTFPAVEGTFAWLPTKGPKVVIVTIRPGSRTPPPQAAVIPGNVSVPGIVPIVNNGGGGNLQAIPATAAAPRSCGLGPAGQFSGAFGRYGQISDRIGCPVKDGFGLKIVSQPFQNGVMFWRETKEMFALTSTGQYFRVQDSWNETLPADDPSLVPPAGLRQPVRGFGYAWRSNPNVKNALGWALGPEQQFDGTWQDFERGFMITGLNGTVYALIPINGDGGQHLGTMTN